MPTLVEQIDQAISILAQIRSSLTTPAVPVQAPNNLPSGWVPFGGVLPEQVGNKAPMPRCFDTHRIIWEAAQRGDALTEGGPAVFTDGLVGWPGPDGKAFRIGDWQKLGTQAVFDVITWFDAESPECAEWKKSATVAPFLPKSSPAMFPLSR